MRSKETGIGFKASIILILLAVLAFLLFSCHGPKVYEFQYSVDIRYTDSSRETIVDTYTTEAEDPRKVGFTLSSRFRQTPCLLLDGEFGKNIACDVQSYKVQVLKYVEVPDDK